MKKNFPAMAEVGMKSRPAEPVRDEFSSSDAQLPFPGPIPPDLTRDFAIRQNPY